jgi:hypothetical protein
VGARYPARRGADGRSGQCAVGVLQEAHVAKASSEPLWRPRAPGELGNLFRAGV